ncbi:MAG: rhodanese-like domain-containing protein [Gammaproteobacteria bacterium]|nr:rhodanese-like domain-containing protein [Gammaproteobacteria bacterium]
MNKIILSLLLLMPFSSLLADVDVNNLAKKKQTPQGLYMTAKDAYDAKMADPKASLFLDVRTRAEVEFVGMADTVDANIPYMTHDKDSWNEKKSRFNSEPNSNFSIAVEEQLKKKGLSKQDKIIVMCRSGSRSAKAANLLSQLGYNNVYSVVDGFEGDKAKSGPNKGHRVVNGWKNANLPWSYKLTVAKMYIEE